MKLLAVDPGLATGLSFFDLDQEIPKMIWSKEVDITTFYTIITSLFDEYPSELQIVCEDFIITVETAKKSLGGNWSIELIGALKYLCHIHSVPMTMQRPADRVTISHDQLRALNYWHVGGAGHANQASRHAVVYMLDTLKIKPVARKLIEA